MNPASFILPTAPCQKIRLGLVGLGWVTANCHLPALRQLSNLGWPIELVAICDRDDATLRAVASDWPSAETGHDPQALLSRTDLDGVLILTHPESSCLLLQRALECQRPVFVEKPVALTPSELRHCVTMASDRAIPVQVGYNRRFQPFARELVRHSAELAGGELHVRSQFWRAARTEQHFFQDTLVHSLDFLSHLLGPLQVSGVRTWPQSESRTTLADGWRIDFISKREPRTTAEIDIRPAIGWDNETTELLASRRSLSLQYPHPSTTEVYARLTRHENGESTILGECRISPTDMISRCYHCGFINQMAEFVLLCAGKLAAPGCGLQEAIEALRLRDDIIIRQESTRAAS